MKKTTVAIVDDHSLFLDALVTLVRKVDGYDVLYVAKNGRDLLDQLQPGNQVPDMALVDLHMPVMDGLETTARLRRLYPIVRVLIVSISDRKDDIGLAIRQGAHGYVWKGDPPEELHRMLDQLRIEVHSLSQLLNGVPDSDPSKSAVQRPAAAAGLTDQELAFLTLACGEMTDQQIADELGIPLLALEEYRSPVFSKLNVRTRVGMIIEAIRQGLIDS